MFYTLKSGALYQESGQKKLAKLKGSWGDPVKRIYREDKEPLLIVGIRYTDETKTQTGDVHCKEYILTNSNGKIIGKGFPGYADGDDPKVTGWPICRMPRVDHARVTIGGADYLLVMHNSQNYTLQDCQGRKIVHFLHKGMRRGWKIECCGDFSPEALCGLFSFCRYIDRENEFLTV